MLGMWHSFVDPRVAHHVEFHLFLEVGLGPWWFFFFPQIFIDLHIGNSISLKISALLWPRSWKWGVRARTLFFTGPFLKRHRLEPLKCSKRLKMNTKSIENEAKMKLTDQSQSPCVCYCCALTFQTFVAKYFPTGTEERKCFDASTGRWSCAENRYANLHHGNREAYETHRGKARITWI